MRKYRIRKKASNIQSRMVPLIDVVFLLLIFFIMTVNFQPQEGFMAAELPGAVVGEQVSEVDPLAFYIDTMADGACKVIFAGNTAIIAKDSTDFSAFAREVERVMTERKRRNSDPVMLVDLHNTSWQHMMNMYDTMISLGYKNIILSDDF